MWTSPDYYYYTSCGAATASASCNEYHHMQFKVIKHEFENQMRAMARVMEIQKMAGSPTSCTAPTWDYDDTYTVRPYLDRYLYGTCARASDCCSPIKWANVLTPRPLADRFGDIIRRRQGPTIIVARNNPLTLPIDIREERARETLRRVIGNDKFRNFLKNGFVSVRARSGLNYQIFPGHGFTSVFDKGKMVERLCVVLQGGFPPTDSLIMRYLLILNNEKQFRDLANKHSVINQLPKNSVPLIEKSLVEIFKELKAA